MKNHIAIMRKSWGLLPKILSGQKTIESRWYKNRCQPWNSIQAGETVYFKNSGEPVTLKATVDKVLQFENLTQDKVKEIIFQYGGDDGIAINDFEAFYEMFKAKRYCLLIFLKDVEKIEPFNIIKKGFGMMSAWITVDSIYSIYKKL